MRHLHLLAWLLASSMVSGRSTAGPVADSTDRYIFSVRRFGVKEGLPHRRITSIAADKRGFLWLTTPAGLVRWDGYAFVTHDHNKELSRDDPAQVVCDPHGDLWVLYDDGIVDIVDPITGGVRTLHERFRDHATRPLDLPVTGISSANDGTVVFAQGNRLFRFRSAEEGLRILEVDCDQHLTPLGVETNGAIWCLCSPGRTGWTVGEMLHIASSEDWSSDHKPRITRFDGFTNAFRTGHDLLDTIPGPGRGLDAIQYNNSAWISPSGSVHAAPDPSWKDTGSTALGSGHLRAPVDHGLCVVNSTIRRMRTGDDVLHAPILFDIASQYPEAGYFAFDALRDRSGNLWVATEFGLFQVTIGTDLFQRWLTSETSDQATKISIRGMVVKDDELHVNTEVHGYHVLDIRDGTVRYAGPPATGGMALHPAQEGGMWCGLPDRIERMSTSGMLQRTSLRAPLNDVWCVLPLPEGRSMIGTRAGIGIGPITAMLQRVHPDYPALDRCTVYHLERDLGGRIIACTSAGLYELADNGEVHAHYGKNASSVDGISHQLPTDDIRHFYQDSTGSFWLSTATQGLLHWNRAAGVVRTIGAREGLPPGSIHAVYLGPGGLLWLPTDNGLARYDPVTKQVHVFTVADGIAHDEFNRIAHTRGPDGRFYFGGLGGITVFDPAELMDLGEPTHAPLVLDAVHVLTAGRDALDDRTSAILHGEAITMLPGDKYFTVDVRHLSFEDPAFVRYAWRVDGIDNDWNIQREPTLRFTTLPYGDHVLRIKAIDGNGRWSTTGLVVPISIVRPVYVRWWFIGLSIMALAGTVFAFVRYREQRLRDVMRVRDRIALDLHDEVGSDLSSIVLFSTAVGLSTTGLPEKATTLLRRIRENSTRAMESMNDIVWSVDPEHDALSDLLDRMRVFAQPLCEVRDIQLEFDVPKQLLSRKLGMAARKNLYLVFKEAVNNAIKHADCTRIHVSMQRADADLVMRVMDNGRGYVPTKVASSLGGNGLVNMRKRADELHGTLTVMGTSDAGTEIVLRFPAVHDQ